MSEQTYSIYVIEDPSSNKVRYVGLSNDPNRRFKQHLSKSNWIKALIKKNVTPQLRIIEENIIELKTAEARERYWIQHYEGTGCQLENLVKNEPAIRERSEAAWQRQRLYDTYTSNLSPNDADKLVRMMLAGHQVANIPVWEDTYVTVVKTINRLAQQPGFGIHLDAFTAARITFDIFGYEWKDEADHE